MTESMNYRSRMRKINYRSKTEICQIINAVSLFLSEFISQPKKKLMTWSLYSYIILHTIKFMKIAIKIDFTSVGRRFNLVKYEDPELRIKYRLSHGLINHSLDTRSTTKLSFKS